MRIDLPGGLLIATLLVTCGDRPRVEEETDIYDASSPLEEDTLASARAAADTIVFPVAAVFAPELGITLGEMEESRTGLFTQDVAEGSGDPAGPGDTAVVHYTGWLPHGLQFDSSRDRGAPFSFTIGEGRVIPGWEEGVTGMRTGGRRKLVIPAKLGYGIEGAGDVIPSGATLVFDIELLEIR